MKIFLKLFYSGIVLFFSFAAQAQLVSVTGHIKDFVSGKAVESVAVYESVSGIGTITNSDGYYKLLLSKGARELKISSPGYESYNLPFKMNADTVISVNLKSMNVVNNRIVSGAKLNKDSTLKSKAKAENPEKKK